MSLNPHLQIPLTPKIGEMRPGGDKYLSWSGKYGYYPNRTSTASNSSFVTEKMLSPAFTLEDLVRNRTINSRQLNRAKSLVEFKGRSNSSGTLTGTMRQSYSRSNFFESYVNYKDYQQLMRERGTPEMFKDAFDQHLRARPNGPGTEVVCIHEVEQVVKDCLGDDCPDFIIYKFRELSIGAAINIELHWPDFCTVVEKVSMAIDAECARHHDLPPLMQLMNRKRVSDEHLGALGDMGTTYRDNFALGGDLEYKQQAPVFGYHRPVEALGENLNKAAKLMCAGTSKITHHIPGYRGHIPVNLRNTKKLEHACGKIAHPQFNNLVLSQQGMGCVLGYTGYVPQETFFPRTERKTSCDPRTSNGAAFGKTKMLL